MEPRNDLCVTCGKRKGECVMCEAQREKCQNYEKACAEKDAEYDKLENKYYDLKNKYKQLKRRDRRDSSSDDDRDRRLGDSKARRRIEELKYDKDVLKRRLEGQKILRRTAEKKEREIFDRTEELMNKAMQPQIQAYSEAANLYINLQKNPERRRVEIAQEQVDFLGKEFMVQLRKLRIENSELKQQLEGKSQEKKEAASTQTDGDVQTLLEPPHRSSSETAQSYGAGPAPKFQHPHQNEPIVYDVEPEGYELNGDIQRRSNQPEFDTDGEGDGMDDGDDVEPQAFELRGQIRKRRVQLGSGSDDEEDSVADVENDAESVVSELIQGDQGLENHGEGVPMKEEEEDDGEAWEVEKVLTARMVNGRKQYFVKWKNSWTYDVHYAAE